MSAEVQPLGQSSKSTVKVEVLPGQSLLVGRCDEVKRTENGVYTVVQTAAVDEYSMPGIHEVQSKRQFARPGEKVSVLVELAGYRRSFRGKDGQTQQAVTNLLRLCNE